MFNRLGAFFVSKPSTTTKYMNFETMTLIVLTAIIIVREISHLLQINNLQKLIKQTEQLPTQPQVDNEIAQESNDIVKNEQDFDIRKATKVIVDNEEIPINII